MPISKGKNGKYYVKVWDNKVLYTPSKMKMSQTSWPNKTDAKAAEVELRRIIQAQSSTMGMTLDLLTLCNRYLKDQKEKCTGHDTFPKKVRFSKEIIKRWRNVPVTDIKVYMAQEYLDDRSKKFTNNSFNSYRKEGVAMFNWAINQQLLPPNAINVFARVKKLPHSTGGPKPAPVEDVKKVMQVANQSQQDLILTYLLTGARKNEILTMKWNDVDMETKTYKLHTNKTGNKRTKTTLHSTPDQLHKVFARKLKERNPDLEYVFWHKFFSQDKKAFVEDRYKHLNKFTERLCIKAGVPHFTLHQLRHLAATLLKESGASLSQMQLFLRHDEQKTTEIYAGHLDNSTTEQTEYLGAFWSAKLNENSDAV